MNLTNHVSFVLPIATVSLSNDLISKVSRSSGEHIDLDVRAMVSDGSNGTMGELAARTEGHLVVESIHSQFNNILMRDL